MRKRSYWRKLVYLSCRSLVSDPFFELFTINYTCNFSVSHSFSFSSVALFLSVPLSLSLSLPCFHSDLCAALMRKQEERRGCSLSLSFGLILIHRWTSLKLLLKMSRSTLVFSLFPPCDCIVLCAWQILSRVVTCCLDGWCFSQSIPLRVGKWELRDPCYLFLSFSLSLPEIYFRSSRT